MEIRFANGELRRSVKWELKKNVIEFETKQVKRFILVVRLIQVEHRTSYFEYRSGPVAQLVRAHD